MGPICKDDMGVQTPEGTVDKPIKLVICCNQHIGENCLKEWLQQNVDGLLRKKTCPMCRFTFPAKFVEKLLGLDVNKGFFASEMLDINRYINGASHLPAFEGFQRS